MRLAQQRSQFSRWKRLRESYEDLGRFCSCLVGGELQDDFGILRRAPGFPFSVVNFTPVGYLIGSLPGRVLLVENFFQRDDLIVLSDAVFSLQLVSAVFLKSLIVPELVALNIGAFLVDRCPIAGQAVPLDQNRVRIRFAVAVQIYLQNAPSTICSSKYRIGLAL